MGKAGSHNTHLLLCNVDRLALNLGFSCLGILTAGITGVLTWPGPSFDEDVLPP